MAFCYVPNGVHMQDWTPKEVGRELRADAHAQSARAVQSRHARDDRPGADKAEANGDGPGDHARAMATFLTGCQAKKTGGADIRVGVSVDQLAAQKVGAATRFASLELSCDKGRQSGECDSGYSCAYSSNISWKTESTPVTPETNPRLVFERLFSGGIGRRHGGRPRRAREVSKEHSGLRVARTPRGCKAGWAPTTSGSSRSI